MDFGELRKQFLVVRQDAGLVMLDPAQDALLVYHENRTVGASQLGIEYAVLGRDRAVGPEIRNERVRNAAQRFAPRLLGGNRITADSQNLAIQPFELGALRVVRRDLAVSSGGKGKRVKSDHHVLLPAILTQLDVDPVNVRLGHDAWQSEIRRALSDFKVNY